MEDMKMASGSLAQVWVTVTDADGSSHLEARWTSANQVMAVHTAHAA